MLHTGLGSLKRVIEANLLQLGCRDTHATHQYNILNSATANFTYNFPALSLTLFTFSPAPPLLVEVPQAQTGNQFALQLQGQPGVRYILQHSTNLTTWAGVVTNTMTSNSLILTNPAPAIYPSEFWRAVWQPY